MSITKKDIINVVAVENQMTKKDAEAAIDSVLKFIGDAIVDGDKVVIRGFGSFSRTMRGPRKCRTQMTGGEQIVVPGRYAARFKPSGEFRKRFEPVAVAG